MPPKPDAILVAEIGNVTTRVTLVDTVDGESRLIGQVAVPSTTEPPYENAAIAILDAATQLTETTGRQLVRDGSLLTPQTTERDGIDALVAVTSASPIMALVIAAVASEVSARSALRASRSTYTTVLQTMTLDDAAGVSSGGDSTWIEREVQALMALSPDLVMIAGGLEDGAQDSLVRLAHIVGLTAFRAKVDAEGQPRVDIAKRTVLFTGNSAARDRVIDALSDRAELRIIDNVRPALEVERLEPARQALVSFYNETLLQALPGATALRRIAYAPLRTVCDATGLMARFIAERDERAALIVDAGSANTAVYLASQGRYSPAVLGGIGTGYGVGGVLAERGLAAIARWLPFPISERDLTHHLLNKMVRPQTVPVTREDVLIDLAVAREALALAMAALRDERGTPPIDYIVAGGGVLANAPHPGLALLAILDALEPTAEDTDHMVEVHLDALGLIGACGALAFSKPEAALTLFDRDLLQNAPLATCAITLGGGRIGDVAATAELREVGGKTQKIEVRHGQIGRLPLPPGRTAQLILRPTGGVRFGRNASGSEVASDVAAISGSALGVVIDARGRPIRLPTEPLARQQRLWDWLTALGVESGELPYEAAEPFSEPPPTEAIEANGNGAISFVETTAPATPPPDPYATPIENDLTKLRQTFEEPPKKGIFRRK